MYLNTTKNVEIVELKYNYIQSCIEYFDMGKFSYKWLYADEISFSLVIKVWTDWIVWWWWCWIGKNGDHKIVFTPINV